MEHNTKILEEFILLFQLEIGKNPDAISISMSMSRDPLLAKVVGITGGSGQKRGQFMGIPVAVKPDVEAVFWDHKNKETK